MANLVEFLVKIRDMASGPLQKIGVTGGVAFQKLQDNIDKVTGRSGKLKESLADINRRLGDLTRTREISLDGRQISRINKEIAELENRKRRLEGGSVFGGGFGGYLKNALIFGGIAGAGLLGREIMKSGMERQMNQVAFEVLAGKKDGTMVNSQMVKFAKDTIYGNEVFGEGKLLLGSGVKANNVLPVMNMIGNIAMGDVERMKSLNLAFAESSSTGKLTGRQELMFRTALFNPLQQLSEMTHKPVAVLQKEMEKGKISINDLVKSMQYATGPAGRWHNMMLKMQETPAGKWQAFTGTLSTMAGTIGLSLMPALGAVTDVLNGLINNTPMLYSVATAIGAMGLAWAGYTVITERAAIIQGILEAAAYWPLALVGVVGYAYAGLNKYNTDYASNTKNSIGSITDVFGTLRRMFEDIVLVTQSVILGIESVFQRMANLGNDLMDSNWSKMWKDATADTRADITLKQVIGDFKLHRKLDYAGKLDDKPGLTPGSNPAFAKYTPGKTGDIPGVVKDANSSITGGGVRNITINVNKSFTDKIEIHSVTTKEGLGEVERLVQEMFLRIVNSGAAAAS